MKNLYKLFVALILIAGFVMVPAFASSDNSVDQNAGATQVGGAGNANVAVNTNGNGNTNVVEINNKAHVIKNEQTSYESVTYGSSTTMTDININAVPSASHYRLDTGANTYQISSLYGDEVLVVPNDGGADTPVLQKPGETYEYTIWSSLPVLCYVINSNDDDKVLTKSGAPVYDPVYKKFEHGWVDVVKYSKIRSTQQQMSFTVKKEGRYSLVIDTRVSQSLNGENAVITANSIDVAYVAKKVTDGTSINEVKKYTGKTEVFMELGNGVVDNTKDVVINNF